MQLGVQDKREAAPPKTLREKTLGVCAPVDSLPLIHLSCTAVQNTTWHGCVARSCCWLWKTCQEAAKVFFPFVASSCGPRLRINHIVTMQSQEIKTSQSWARDSRRSRLFWGGKSLEIESYEGSSCEFWVCSSSTSKLLVFFTLKVS